MTTDDAHRRDSLPSECPTMLDLLRSFSDDQLAIGGCVLALMAGGLMVQLAYTFGPEGRKQRLARRPRVYAEPQPLRHADDRAA
jgi:hypothetical protein